MGTLSVDRVELKRQLRIGLAWLSMRQPSGAVVSHHGIHRRVGGLSISISAMAANRRPVVVFSMIEGGEVDGPFFDAGLCGMLRDFVHSFRRVNSHWNGVTSDGVGLRTFSVGLLEQACATLRDAQFNYHHGCPRHRSVFCGSRPTISKDPDWADCTWYQDGKALVRVPKGWSK